MQFATILVAAVSALTASAAPAAVQERGCKVAYPTPGYVYASRYYEPDYVNSAGVVFDIPEGATGACDLRVKFNETYVPGGPSLGGNTQVDFKYLGGAGTTYTFRPGPLDSTIGSFGCADVMDFTLTVSPEQGEGGYVGFYQNERTGLYITHSC
ncbi:hypothetical protein MKZ38_002185 [Zalerion maritima]|uniref:Ubiquitin 3 binding protein But2 C-terminal domain-containing protein n=1 Tax=Zalerion maritima TaxID=339359 RepID=A0AAD5RQA9_9PEZI|nr:hypothetical protein MKZ38_002185 [Zalerion maritima]